MPRERAHEQAPAVTLEQGIRTIRDEVVARAAIGEKHIRQAIDRVLLAETLVGSALHALIARASFEICSKLSFDVPNDVFRFWFQAGPAIVIWCAVCMAGHWSLHDGLTDDGRALWGTLIYIGVGGWLFSGLGALFHGFGGWHK